ncbi:MAG: diguanylate cyclase [Gaiellales bacterium]|nr:diguanylate cyclase [Gaiellales bacterium]
MMTLLIIRVEGVGPTPDTDQAEANLRLLRTAQVFEASVRKRDFLARLSHHQFGLLLSRADARAAGLVCARLTRSAEKLSENDRETLRFRFGVASGPPAQTTFRNLLREATASLNCD